MIPLLFFLAVLVLEGHLVFGERRLITWAAMYILRPFVIVADLSLTLPHCVLLPRLVCCQVEIEIPHGMSPGSCSSTYQLCEL